LRVPEGPVATDVVVGGDVMLGRSIGAQIEKGIDPFAGVRAVLDRATTRVVNLESVVSAEGTVAPQKRFHLRAPLEATNALSAAGIDVISLANNHAADFGSSALLDSIRRLRAAGRVVIGAGGNESEAYAARRSATGKIGFIAVSDLESEKPTPITGPVIASSSDRAQLARAIVAARAQFEFLIALVHWGEENSEVVIERQRELARWLVDHGVDLIAGSHPHCIQPLDFYHGRPIVYSLGNLVFDGAPTVTSWNKGQLLEVGLPRKRGAPPSLRLVPVKLDERGFPQLTSPPRELTQR
jgi:poly-gamma-glutamate synthesis protein (capsule biosynthesis protein)